METAAGEGHRYTPREEIANSVTHGFGIILAIAGLGVLTAFATLHGTAAHIVGCSIFGATLILLYTTSTLYHSIPIQRAKSVLRKGLDGLRDVSRLEASSKRLTFYPFPTARRVFASLTEGLFFLDN